MFSIQREVATNSRYEQSTTITQLKAEFPVSTRTSFASLQKFGSMDKAFQKFLAFRSGYPDSTEATPDRFLTYPQADFF